MMVVVQLQGGHFGSGTGRDYYIGAADYVVRQQVEVFTVFVQGL